MQKAFLIIIALLLIIPLSACQSGSSENVDELLKSARAHLDAREYEEAVADLETAVEKAPDHKDAHFLLGQAYNKTGDLLKAADQFRRVLELNPESAAAHHNLGVTYFQLQDPQTAIAEFEAALKIEPDDADTHYQLGATYLVLALSGNETMSAPDQDILEQAISEFERALELRENMPEALIGLGNVHTQMGDYDAAIEMLEQAIEQVPESPEAHYALGGAYAQKGNREKACETYQHFLTLDPPSNWKAQAEQAIATLGCE